MGQEKTQRQVTRLLKRGLNHYGLGDLEEAIGCWEQARAVDPDNQAVHDYLETAYEELGHGVPRRTRPTEDESATPRSMDQVTVSSRDPGEEDFAKPVSLDDLPVPATERHSSAGSPSDG